MSHGYIISTSDGGPQRDWIIIIYYLSISVFLAAEVFLQIFHCVYGNKFYLISVDDILRKRKFKEN